MNPHMSTTMPGAMLTIKCLKCKNVYEEKNITVAVEAIIDPDSGEFVQYDVLFTGAGSEGTRFIDDLLCLPKHCSVVGRTDRSIFAFPWLVKAKRGETWHSRPDNTGTHLAMATPKVNVS